MGAVVAAVVTAVSSAFGGFSITGFLSQRLLGGAISFGLSSLSRGLAGKPKGETRGSVARGLTETLRQAVTERRVIYGTSRVGGTMVALGTGEDQKYLYIAVVLASHDVAGIDTVYFNDDPIFADMIDGSGLVTSGTYANVARIEKMNGADAQSANSNMLAEISDWTSDHRLQGVAYLYVRLKYDRNAYPSGIPNISATVRGREISDPRDGQTKFTDNPALCVRDYLRDERYGRSVQLGELEDSFFIAAANICDEMVPCLAVDGTVDSVDVGKHEIVLEGNACPFQTGDRVQMTSSGTFPGGLAALTDYYVIVRRERAFADETIAPVTSVRLAASRADAMAGTHITLSSAGTGDRVLSKKAEPRYSCNGVVTLDRQPSDILNDLVAAMAGRLVYIGGTWRVFAGAAQSSQATFGDNDFVAPIVVQTRRSRRDRYNALKGQYAGPLSFYQPTDYPAVKIAVYKADDNDVEIFGQLDLGFTTRAQTAQRIARIAIERNRREMACQVEVNLRGLAVQAGDVIALTHAHFGWVEKTFEIIDWTLSTQEQEGSPLLTVKMNLIETDASVFAYDFATDENIVLPPPRTVLPNGLSVAGPTGLTVESGDDHIYVRQDGTVFSRMLVSWVAANGPIDRYEINYRETVAAAWQRPVFVSFEQTEVYLLEAQEGQIYEIRVRAISASGAASGWTVATHTVDGKTLPPSNVEQFFANANGNVVYFAWKKVPDRDIAGYEIRYGAAGSVDWDGATIVKVAERGNELTTAAIPPGSWNFMLKALDTSGNYSTNFISAAAIVTNSNTIIAEQNSQTDWTGTKTNMIQHWASGKLVPSDMAAASANGFDTFDVFLQSPYTDYAYEGAEMDIGSVVTGAVRVWLDVTGGVNTHTTPGGALFDYDTFLDTRDSGSYDGYESWDIGERSNFRYCKSGITLDMGAGPSYLTRFHLVADAPARTETRSVNVTGGSASVSFVTPFLTPPLCRVSNAESNTNIAGCSTVTATGFTASLLTPLGAPASGIIIYDATGV